MDRTLLMAFGCSLACHVVLLGFQLVDLHQLIPVTSKPVLDVIYEHQLAEQELRRLQQQLETLRESPKLAELGGGPSASAGLGASLSQIRIPQRPILGASTIPSETMTGRSAVVDLTNLVDAAQGDPVLLSYFSAIREQIQRTANQQAWLTREAAAEGLVYVSFILSSSGRVLSMTVQVERSTPLRVLQDISLRIIKAAGPFAPFPPSLSESSKTIVVPLEFLYGS